VYKRDYAFRMSVMKEIFEIRSCIESLANDTKVNTANQYMFYILSVLSVDRELQGTTGLTNHQMAAVVAVGIHLKIIIRCDSQSR